jgi:acylphosphatase
MCELCLAGWVRNLPDGTVEAVLEGDETRVAEALDFLRRGPPGARVTGVDVRDEPWQGERGFEVRR